MTWITVLMGSAPAMALVFFLVLVGVLGPKDKSDRAFRALGMLLRLRHPEPPAGTALGGNDPGTDLTQTLAGDARSSTGGRRRARGPKPTAPTPPDEAGPVR